MTSRSLKDSGAFPLGMQVSQAHQVRTNTLFAGMPRHDFQTFGSQVLSPFSPSAFPGCRRVRAIYAIRSIQKCVVSGPEDFRDPDLSYTRTCNDESLRRFKCIPPGMRVRQAHQVPGEYLISLARRRQHLQVNQRQRLHTFRILSLFFALSSFVPWSFVVGLSICLGSLVCLLSLWVSLLSSFVICSVRPASSLSFNLHDDTGCRKSYDLTSGFTQTCVGSRKQQEERQSVAFDRSYSTRDEHVDRRRLADSQ